MDKDDKSLYRLGYSELLGNSFPFGILWTQHYEASSNIYKHCIDVIAKRRQSYKRISSVEIQTIFENNSATVIKYISTPKDVDYFKSSNSSSSSFFGDELKLDWSDNAGRLNKIWSQDINANRCETILINASSEHIFIMRFA
uniref:Uncharacterized protein n=1 Tax=Romanomermis culicivorax TaxID=13658 RepID=A0A915L317_ROMCU